MPALCPYPFPSSPSPPPVSQPAPMLVRAPHGVQLLHVLPVRAGVALAVPQRAEHGDEARGEQRAQRRADPVDPVLGREVARHGSRAEAAGRVEGGAGEVDAW